PERDTFRQQWMSAAQSLLAGPPEAAADGTGTSASAPGSLHDNFAHYNTDLFVKNMCNSSFATTMSIHLNMWH
ncbi:MAG TPA: hypothetical protein VNB49_17180, partial [Candidatus Dormibacteraeota bacterium]|nr:hypothetical protein [Candidatus Dormibacteraeota bacterium]